MRLMLFFFAGIFVGSMIAIQSILNSALGRKTGSLGSVLIVTVVSAVVVLIPILFFPGSANLRASPGLSEWYLYLGGVMGIVILSATVILVPEVGTTTTLTSLVMGQLLMSVVIDHYGLFNFPKIEISLARIAGVAFLIVGAFLIVRK